jgi:Phospholipase_D-nuclease N-terminal
VKTAVSLGAVLIVALLDIFVSVRIARSEVTSRPQKAAWLLFVWLVPVVGAMLAVQVSREANLPGPVPDSFEDGPGPSLGMSGGGNIGTGGNAGGCGLGPGGSCGGGDS